MRHVVRAAAAALLAIAAVLPARAENVTFITDFGFNGRHAYYYVALERGYYRQAGLDVSFVRGNGSADAIRKVGAGAAQLGFADAGSLVLARANDGVPVRMVAVVYAAPPHAIYAIEDGPIRRPQDLVGRRIADSAGSANAVLFGAYAKAAGFDPSRVTWQIAESAALPLLLATGAASLRRPCTGWRMPLRIPPWRGKRSPATRSISNRRSAPPKSSRCASLRSTPAASSAPSIRLGWLRR